MKLEPKNHLKPSSLNGISNEQIEPHFEAHYKGYVAKFNEIQDKLADLNFSDRAKANQNYSEYRELKVEETFNYMGTVLHELYFGHLTPKGTPSEALKKKVEEDFGSWDNCVTELKAAGIAFRGWAILGLDIFSGKLMINGLDAHNLYNLTGLIPLIVLDTYEHAYYVDQKNKRPPYIDAFLNSLNWDVINERFEKAIKAYETLKGFLLIGGKLMALPTVEEVEEALDEIRPALRFDGGDIELVSIEEDGTVLVRLMGACSGCGMSTLTLKAGVERALKQKFPDIKEVKDVNADLGFSFGF